MSSVERRLHQALQSDPSGRASPDLLARVLGSIADDGVRRRRRRNVIAAWVVSTVLAATLILTLTPQRNGRLVMDWWILELATTALLIGLAFWLGPFIKRFGKAYAADVFHDNPQTGKSFIVLTDIVYYLIFTAYILFTVSFEATSATNNVDASQLKLQTARIGGILLIIGVLHGLNLVLMPVLGRLFSMNRHLAGPKQRRGADDHDTHPHPR